MERITYQEILIANDSSFFAKELLQREPYPGEARRSSKEQLAEACWSGLLRETLPELCPPLDLQQINEGIKFLNVCMGERTRNYSVVYSINPYFFLNHTRKN